MAVERDTSEEHSKANGHVPDQVYRDPTSKEECWRVAFNGRVRPTDFTSREAAEAYLNDLRRGA